MATNAMAHTKTGPPTEAAAVDDSVIVMDVLADTPEDLGMVGIMIMTVRGKTETGVTEADAMTTTAERGTPTTQATTIPENAGTEKYLRKDGLSGGFPSCLSTHFL